MHGDGFMAGRMLDFFADYLDLTDAQQSQAKEILEKSYRLIPPDEVLHRLNHDFIDQALSDTPFITMTYGLFDFRQGVLHFSRAGHPYPIYVPREGALEQWHLEGSLLGVFATQYRLRKQPLRPGDKVLFYTDAIDMAGFGDHPVGVASLLAAIEEYRVRIPALQILHGRFRKSKIARRPSALLHLSVLHLENCRRTIKSTLTCFVNESRYNDSDRSFLECHKNLVYP